MKNTFLFGSAIALVLAAGAASAATLDDVKARGTLKCGVNTGLAGFAAPDATGQWEGFDVAVCRALAAAVLGDPEKVEFTPTTGETRFTALASGEVDVLSRNSTWTFSRDVDLKFTFAGVNYYDGQGFMVSKDLGVTSALELDGATVCIQTGTTTELNLADFFKANGISYQPVPIQTNAEADQQFHGRRLRRLHHRRLRPRRQPRHLREPGRTGSSCPRSSPRSRSGRWCARATTSGPTSSAGR